MAIEHHIIVLSEGERCDEGRNDDNDKEENDNGMCTYHVL